MPLGEWRCYKYLGVYLVTGWRDMAVVGSLGVDPSTRGLPSVNVQVFMPWYVQLAATLGFTVVCRTAGFADLQCPFCLFAPSPPVLFNPVLDFPGLPAPIWPVLFLDFSH